MNVPCQVGSTPKLDFDPNPISYTPKSFSLVMVRVRPIKCKLDFTFFQIGFFLFLVKTGTAVNQLFSNSNFISLMTCDRQQQITAARKKTV